MKLVVILISSLFLMGGACPSESESLLDEVKTLLDKGEFAQAALKADELVTASDTVEHRLLAASAYFGKAELDLVDLIGDFSGFVDDVDGISDLKQMACIVQMANPTTQLADLRSAVANLDAIEDSVLSLKENNEAAFQLGMLQALEAYILPTNRGAEPVAGTTSNCTTAEFTVNETTLDLITEEDAASVLNDFIIADDHLRGDAGLKNDNEIMETLFETYCRLQGASTNAGFSREELQAFVWCELDPGNFPAAGFGSVASCAAFLESELLNPNSSSITSCKNGSDLTE